MISGPTTTERFRREPIGKPSVKKTSSESPLNYTDKAASDLIDPSRPFPRSTSGSSSDTAYYNRRRRGRQWDDHDGVAGPVSNLGIHTQATDPAEQPSIVLHDITFGDDDAVQQTSYATTVRTSSPPTSIRVERNLYSPPISHTDCGDWESNYERFYLERVRATHERSLGILNPSHVETKEYSTPKEVPNRVVPDNTNFATNRLSPTKLVEYPQLRTRKSSWLSLRTAWKRRSNSSEAKPDLEAKRISVPAVSYNVSLGDIISQEPQDRVSDLPTRIDLKMLMQPLTGPPRGTTPAHEADNPFDDIWRTTSRPLHALQTPTSSRLKHTSPGPGASLGQVHQQQSNPPEYFNTPVYVNEPPEKSSPPSKLRRPSIRRFLSSPVTLNRRQQSRSDLSSPQSSPLTSPRIPSTNARLYPRATQAPLTTSYLCEAQRISTPPLRHEKSGKLKGFFFDVRTPSADSPTGNDKRYRHSFPGPIAAETPATTPGKPLTSRSRDWYRVRMDDIMGASSDDNNDFEWDIPEHLPNSPLCPLHPKHAGKGKGICVYHGRKKTLPPRMTDDELLNMLTTATSRGQEQRWSENPFERRQFMR